ncbi:MAG: hypothetical protein JWN17_705 [Frankiales bacterium]|nr:hypothetical protein [Frankiales bacterium]
MSAAVVLADTSLEVVPGETLTVKVVVTNTGTVVDAIGLDVVGLPEGWARVEPAEVRLLPGRRREVELLVAPPRASTTATGLAVLGVRAQCREDPGGSCVEEAVLEVLPFTDVAAELVPRSRRARGRRRARFVVAVDNRGNAPVTVGLDAYDPDQDLVLAIGQPQLQCLPGSATFATLLVRGQSTYWRGPDQAKGFLAVVVVPGQPQPLELAGTLDRRAVLPQSLPRVATRFALLGAALAALLLLGPSLVRASTGGGAATEAEKASVEQALKPANDTAREAAADAEAARRAAEEALAKAKAVPSAGPVRTAAPVPRPGAQPFTARLQVSGTSTAPFLRIGPDQALSLDGFVLQPNGDRGEMALLRDGVALVTARLGDTQVFQLPSPVLFGPASTVQFSVVCRNPEGDPCDAALLLTGTARTVPVATPAPSPGAVASAPAPAPQPARTADPLPAAPPG